MIVSNIEIIQVFYDDLRSLDKSLFDAKSGGSFLGMYEHEAMYMIDRMV